MLCGARQFPKGQVCYRLAGTGIWLAKRRAGVAANFYAEGD